MRVYLITTVFLIGAAAVSGPVLAQTAPLTRTIPVTFTGVVSETAADTLLIAQPGGGFTTFQGKLPPLPYAQGDPFTISFNAVVPTREYYDSGAYTGEIAADGIYRITVAPEGSGPMYPFYAFGADISRPFEPTLSDQGTPTRTDIQMVYDYNTDSYSLEGAGRFRSFFYTSPGYNYDPASGTFVACNVSGAGACASVNTFSGGGPSGNEPDTVRTGPISTGSFGDELLGSYSWVFSGSWNLPQFQGSVSVPEPGTTGLFGLASLAVMMRRRKKRRTQS